VSTESDGAVAESTDPGAVTGGVGARAPGGTTRGARGGTPSRGSMTQKQQDAELGNGCVAVESFSTTFFFLVVIFFKTTPWE